MVALAVLALFGELFHVFNKTAFKLALILETIDTILNLQMTFCPDGFCQCQVTLVLVFL